MSSFKAFLAIGAIAMASLVVGDATSVFAVPSPTFSFTSLNFQTDGGDPAVPFGVATAIPSAGVIVDSLVSISPAIPGLTTGGLEFISFDIETIDGSFLNADSGAGSVWAISGFELPSSTYEFLTFLSFSIDDVPVALDLSGVGLPTVPNPSPLLFGADAVPIDVMGDPVDPVVFDILALTGAPLLTTLLGFGVSFGDALAINGMTVGFEVVHIPEPATLALMGLGLCSTLLMRRRR